MFKRIQNWFAKERARLRLCEHLKVKAIIPDIALIILAHAAEATGDITAERLLNDWKRVRS